MKKLLNSGLLLIGAAALTLTLATAEGKCGNTQKGMMDNAGKCGNSTKDMMDKSGKCGNSTKGMMDNSSKCGSAMEKKEAPKPAPAKGKCGQGKCG